MAKHLIELKVNYHPSGNYTLTEKVDQQMPKDLSGPLFVNADKGEFYRAVALKLAAISSLGSDYRIVYKDADYQDEAEYQSAKNSAHRTISEGNAG